MRGIKESDNWALLQGEGMADHVTDIARTLRERLEVMQMSGIDYLPKAKTESLAAKKGSDLLKPALVGVQETRDAITSLLALPVNPAQKLESLKRDIIGECSRCKLCSGRTKLVFGAGSPLAELVFVGEGPGADEDIQGEPFVGRAGKLLEKMIEAMGFSREQVYICNVVKCRPPDNRDPEPNEVEACEPFLKAQLAIIKPKVIVALGRYACQCLLRTTEPMGKIRGQWRSYEGISLMPTFHPAYLLRSPSKKREVWEDLQQVMQALGLK